ncbi:MAG: hypothetical protein M3179_05800 [Actinomycetota bacterium]|nr:hypothetical protein [Actinomycetota bacterium]
MKKIAWLTGLVTLLGTGGYIFVYLYRWEWHRALIVAMLFIAAEVAMATAVVLRRLRTVQLGLATDRRPEPEPAVLERLRSNAPRRNPFAWLEPGQGHTAVFIPVLLGSGVLVSALAWVVERVAGRTAEPAMERRLAGQLTALGFPAAGLVPDEAELLAQDRSSAHDDDLDLLLGPRVSP